MKNSLHRTSDEKGLFLRSIKTKNLKLMLVVKRTKKMAGIGSSIAKTVGKANPYIAVALTVAEIAYRGYKIYKEYNNDKIKR